MPSKLGFGNTRKKSSPALYGSAKHYKNPIQKKMETLPGIDTKLDKNPIQRNTDAATQNLQNTRKIVEKNKPNTDLQSTKFKPEILEIAPHTERRKPTSPKPGPDVSPPPTTNTKPKKKRGWFGLKDMGITEALDAMTKKQNE